MQRFTPPALLLISACALLAVTGCKNFEKPVSAARSDAQIAGEVQTKLSSEQAFSGSNGADVRVAVSNGVATLSGQAPDESTRLMAANDASKVAGVREVVNAMTLSGEQSSNQNQNAASCVVPHRAHHRAKTKIERAPELASSYVPHAPAPEPAPVPPSPPQAPAYAQPACGCGPAYVPAPVVVPAPVAAYGYGYAPAIGVGIYARPGYARPHWVGPVRPYAYGRPYPYGRPGGYGRPGARGFVR